MQHMTNPTVVSIDQKRFLHDAQHFFEVMARSGRFDEPLVASQTFRGRSTIDSRYSAFCTTIGLALTMLPESVPGRAWGELGRALLLIASTGGVDQIVCNTGPEIGALSSNRQQSGRLGGQVKAAPQDKPVIDALSRREMAIIALIGRGHSNKEIARQLQVTPETVKTHVKRIFLKLGVEKRAQAVSRAHALGLISEESNSNVGGASVSNQFADGLLRVARC
jgi:LuxR family maltose regulon positive regulatory protein